MAIEDLFNHRVRIWRPTTAAGSLGGTTNTYAQVGSDPAGPNARVSELAPLPFRSTGAGEYSWGNRRVSMAAGTDLRERDILQVYAGPEAPVRLRVSANPARPTDFSMAEHHVKAECEPFRATMYNASGQVIP